MIRVKVFDAIPGGILPHSEFNVKVEKTNGFWVLLLSAVGSM